MSLVIRGLCPSCGEKNTEEPSGSGAFYASSLVESCGRCGYGAAICQRCGEPGPKLISPAGLWVPLVVMVAGGILVNLWEGDPRVVFGWYVLGTGCLLAALTTWKTMHYCRGRKPQ